MRVADTLEELARDIGVDPDGLVRTVQRFNAYAVKGLDPEFGRGQSAYNDCLGDPGHKPNASLGPLDQPPYYATEIYPGDVGTCGGLITNEHAQVLDGTDTPIPGLYATGNVTATVMGRTYPGAGASIANTHGLRLRRRAPRRVRTRTGVNKRGIAPPADAGCV